MIDNFMFLSQRHQVVKTNVHRKEKEWYYHFFNNFNHLNLYYLEHQKTRQFVRRHLVDVSKNGFKENYNHKNQFDLVSVKRLYRENMTVSLIFQPFQLLKMYLISFCLDGSVFLKLMIVWLCIGLHSFQGKTRVS